MKIVKKGKIVSVASDGYLMDGESAERYTVEVADDIEGTGGYYIYYKSPDKKKGFDSWHLPEELETNLEAIEKKRGWIIEWDE